MINSKNIKCKVFIGSSVEGLKIAYAIQQNLRHNAETTVWDQGVFELSSTTIESLITVLDNSDFGIFVFSPDDLVKIRGVESQVVRDNVLFELGLFIGRLGRNRAFIVVPEGTDFKLPTDLLGITPGTYEIGRSDNSDQAATGATSHQIRLSIEKYGPRIVEESEPKTGNDGSTSIGKNDDFLWIDLYFEKKYLECIEELEKQIKKETDSQKILNLKLRIAEVNWLINPMEGDKEFKKLIEKNKLNPSPYLWYINTLLQNDIYEGVPSLIENGITIIPESKDDFISIKADYFVRIGEEQTAKESLENSIAEVKSVKLYLKLVDLHTDMKISHKIIHEAFLNYPTDEQIILKYADIAYNLGLNEISLFLHDKLIKINKNNSSYWTTLGNTFLNLGLHNRAMVSYQKGDELAESNQAWILGNIGNLYNVVELQSKAIEYLELALKKDEKSEYAHNRLSTAIKKKEKEDKKIEELLKKGRIEIRNISFDLTEE